MEKLRHIFAESYTVTLSFVVSFIGRRSHSSSHSSAYDLRQSIDRIGSCSASYLLERSCAVQVIQYNKSTNVILLSFSCDSPFFQVTHLYALSCSNLLSFIGLTCLLPLLWNSARRF